MKFLDSNNEVWLCDGETPVKVASILNGATYNIQNGTTSGAAIVIVYPNCKNGIQDVFIFTDEKKLPIHVLQSRDLCPHLRSTYIAFFRRKDYSLEEFISRVATDYFIKQLSYNFKDSRIPDITN